MLKIAALATGTLLLLAAPASAHLNPAEHGSLMAGLSHPLFGADHILAMVAVGAWAAMLGGTARLAVPASFVTLMGVGFLAAMAGLAVPMVEPMILASLVALGLLLAFAVRLPLPAAMASVGLFALFHGAAHGGELGAATAVSFAVGFLAATALLHGAGLALGTLATRYASPLVLKIVGLVSAGAGALMIAG